VTMSRRLPSSSGFCVSLSPTPSAQSMCAPRCGSDVWVASRIVLILGWTWEMGVRHERCHLPRTLPTCREIEAGQYLVRSGC
jgi:hypothetical protein